MKPFPWKLLTLVGVLAAVVAIAIYHALNSLQIVLPPQTPTIESKAFKPPPNYSMLAERIETLAYREPTSEELKEEKQYNREKALALSSDLNDPDPHKRIGAVEQLAAYTSAEAEDLLTQVLAQDTDVNVRAMAAQTLDTMEKPSLATIDAVLQAIEDDAPEVQQASLLTLERWLNNEPGEAHRAHIVQGLKGKAQSKRLGKETREYLQELLRQARSG